jgi:hypothetical protein
VPRLVENAGEGIIRDDFRPKNIESRPQPRGILRLFVSVGSQRLGFVGLAAQGCRPKARNQAGRPSLAPELLTRTKPRAAAWRRCRAGSLYRLRIYMASANARRLRKCSEYVPGNITETATEPQEARARRFSSYPAHLGKMRPPPNRFALSETSAHYFLRHFGALGSASLENDGGAFAMGAASSSLRVP